jgi:hypothetical protein
MELLERVENPGNPRKRRDRWGRFLPGGGTRKRRRRNPGAETLAAFVNEPAKRRKYRRRNDPDPGPRRRYRRRNPDGVAGIMRGVMGIRIGQVAGVGAGLVGNMMLPRALPPWFQRSPHKYVALVAAPVAARVLLGDRWGGALAVGGLAAVGLHVLNDFVLPGQLIPAALAYPPAAAAAAAAPAGDVGAYEKLRGYERVRGLGAGREKTELEKELELLEGPAAVAEDEDMGFGYSLGAEPSIEEVEAQMGETGQTEAELEGLGVDQDVLEVV